MKTDINPDFEKKIIRKRIQKERDNLSAAEHATKSQLIAEKLIDLSEYKEAKTIFIFYPFRSEVDTRIIIKDALIKGKKIVLPKIINSEMKTFYISDLDKDLKKGSLGISEPEESICKEAKLENIDLVIVPGICFDLNFNRIGYGGGFYDKISPELKKNIKKIALSFDLQIISKVPFCSHDKKVDVIITESEIYRNFKADEKRD
ncbi:5-formyltetrahydrofolate cyclo-ligase [bacterium]|nr:5-formyltetrahydrofolate cyclo-ligase [bacterium]